MPGTIWRRGLAVAGAIVVLGGCSHGPSSEEERTAQELVVGLLERTSMNSYAQSIDQFARAADGARDAGASLVDVEETGGTDDTLGYLTFAVPLDAEIYTHTSGSTGLQPVPGWDPGPYCFRVTFDAYGRAGEHGTDDGIDLVDCPDDTGPITPPQSTDPVVAPGARETARAVLEALALTGTFVEDDVAAQIDALLPTEVEGRPVAPARVAVEGSAVGVAMGGADDCVLVAWVDGAVTDVYPPDIYLQPGELGCTPWTALATDLRPPH